MEMTYKYDNNSVNIITKQNKQKTSFGKRRSLEYRPPIFYNIFVSLWNAMLTPDTPLKYSEF